MKKRIIMIAAAAALSVLMAFPAFAGTWKDVNGRWRYQRGAEKYASQEWLNLDGKRYYIGSDGFMVTGWFTDEDGNRYYLSPVSDGTQGRMVTGWQTIDGRSYYFQEESNGTRGALREVH